MYNIKDLYNIEDLIEQIEDSKRNINTSMVRRAYEFARDLHSNQFRVSGESYINHPVQVCCILFELGMDTETLCAGLLHDIVEDTECTCAIIAKEFNQSIANLVDGVTKLGQLSLTTKEEQQTENVRKMLLAMSEDIRVIIIKLADRLHNMRTMDCMPEKNRRFKSLEVMEVYAPIAHRLGMRKVKEELEDLSLHYLDPIACAEIEKTLLMKKNDREEFIKTIQTRIIERLALHKIAVQIDGRIKSLYGIYRKVYMSGKSFDEVYDIYAVRVIVENDFDCYNVLGVIHDMFTPIPNRFKDYVSTPKPNGYQSLHTTVISKESIPFEVQIRTQEMHYTAEYGIAAHWKYKAGLEHPDKLEQTLAWVRQIIQNQQESEGAEDLIKTIKNDLATDEVYAFTPKGDVKCLPLGSTIVDFAYSIHGQVGNRMMGAKINSRIVSLDTKIKTGNIIEIITTKSPNHSPNREWINIAKTSEARGKIRAWFKKERREENVQNGKADIEREFKKNGIIFTEAQYIEYMTKLAKRQHYETIDDFYAAIGYGGVILSKIIPRIKEEYQKFMKPIEDTAEPIVLKPVDSGKSGSIVVVEGIPNCEVKLARCCSPVLGDDIVGYITRGHGVSVHKRDCPNMLCLYDSAEHSQRFIGVHWGKTATPTNFRATIDIISHNGNSLLVDVGTVLSNSHIPINEMYAKELKNGNANLVLTISIPDIEQLKTIIQKLKKISGIISVERTGKN